MSPFIANGTTGFAIRRPTNPEIEALCAIGYRIEGGYGDGTLPFHSAQNDDYLPICGAIAAGVDDDGPNCHDRYIFSACDLIVDAPFIIPISEILANDRGVQPTLDPSCIDAIVGNIIFNATTTNITITGASLGMNVLSYIPISAATGEEANTTFIYFTVEPCINNCMHLEPCNVVCNSSLINDCTFLNPNTYTIPLPPGVSIFNLNLENCAIFDGWHSCFGSPNLILNTTFPLLQNFPSPPAAIGMWSSNQGGEAVIGAVNIAAGQRYILSFHRAVSPLVGVLGGATLHNLFVRLIDAGDASCNTAISVIPNPIPNSQTIYTETNLPVQGWQQAVTCFTATNAYNSILINGMQNGGGLPYFLIDDISIMPDTFFSGDTTINTTCCNSVILSGNSCDNVIPNMFYTWELQNPNNGNWELVEGETEPTLMSAPACDNCLHYRLIRNIQTQGTAYPVTGNFACLADTAHFTVCGNCCPPEPIPVEQINSNFNLLCCLDTVAFALQPGMPQVTNDATTDNRPAYIVPANATWTPTNNDFVTLGLTSSGSPIVLDVDIIVPAGITLFLQDIRMIFSPNTRFLVKRGARLLLNSTQFQTHLSGMCNSVWQGIQVEGPGLGIQRGFNSGTGFNNFGIVLTFGSAQVQVLIEDAIIGIATQNLPIMDVYGISLAFNNNAIFNPQNSTSYPTLTAVLLTNYLNQAGALATAGGVSIVNSDMATFLNCFHGINLSWFNNSFNGQPRSQVLRARFISDGLKYPFSNLFTMPRTEAGVYMQNYRSVEIGEIATSATNTFTGLKYGIRAEECTRVTILNNRFDACTVGISAATASIFPLASQYMVNNNQINNARVAMQFSGTSMEVSQNSINATPSSIGIIGIFARGCLFNIENQNIINNNTFGCILMNTGLLPNTIRNNDFNNNAVGIWAFGNNGVPLLGGVQITCNRFDNGAFAIVTQDYVVNGTVLTVGSIDNQGDCLFGNQNPADNVFNPVPGLPTIFTDIRALHTGGMFTYFHRADIPGVAQFMPTLSVNVINSLCTPPDSPEENCGNRNLLSDNEIRGMNVLGLLNSEMLRKARYYEKGGDTSAAVNLLESVNNEFAQRLLLQKYMEQNDTAMISTTLTALPAATEDQQHFRKTAEIQWLLKSQNRTYLQLTPQEETDLRNIATAYSPSAHYAQTMLLIARGEEYPAVLPDFPSFLDTALLNQLLFEGINFKNKLEVPLVTIGNLYPNPANNIVYLDYDLPEKFQAVFTLYDATGRVLYVSHLQNSGQMQYAVPHLPNGIYFYHIAVNGQPWLYNKLVLVR
ncbi:MAG TPA: T9SS type A sorting domain-containing protein [Chitinophagales bacterium]|nr:T9SS type A sorting domain-containing protein [Chitinophagales bacterium]HRK29252.1 T9SS type A sorting domain-containing protein [Chitinophagales bacterium]